MMSLLRKLAKVSFYGLVTVVLVLGVVVLGLRYWLLPDIDNYRNGIAAYVSQAAGTRVTIGAIRADWDGLRPHLELTQVQVFGADNDSPALELVEVGATISWRSLLMRTLRLQSLEIFQPSLEVKRDRAGQLFVAGLPMDDKRQGGGISELIFETRSVFIDGAVVSWEDQLRGAPALVLDGVSLHLKNRGSRHRFGLVANPPDDLAGHVDVRGDVHGNRLGEWKNWSGEIYAELPYADASEWRRYVSLPGNLVEGRGALRLWLDFNDRAVRSLVADVKLSDTRVRLADDSPELDLAALEGRIRYAETGKGYEVAARKLSLITRADVHVGPTEFFLRRQPALARENNSSGLAENNLPAPREKEVTGQQGKESTEKLAAERHTKERHPTETTQDARGEFHASQLDLAAWAALSESLPLGKGLRQRIAAFAPSGRVSDLSYRWSGEPGAPVSYALAGRIEHGAVNSVDAYPGVAGLSGNVEANENGGTVSLSVASQTTRAVASQITWPTVFAAPLPIDHLSVQAKWRRIGNATEIRFGEASFSNADLAGSASGSFRAIPGQRGVIDVNARLSRFDGSRLDAYLPHIVGAKTRAWLARAIVKVTVDEVRLRLAGDLKDFPFADEKNGQFLLSMKLRNGVLDYAEAWPRIDNIRADFTLRGHGLAVKASEGSIFNAKLANVLVGIADLKAIDPLLEVSGEASGPVDEKLRFINQSPVKNMIGAFTEGISGSGSGKLRLKLAMPLHEARTTQVDGDYLFQNAGFDLGAGLPPISEVNGHLLFSEKGVRGQNIAGKILGGPVLVNVATRPEGETVIDGKGSASIEAVRAFTAEPWLRYVSGAAEWQGKMRLSKGYAELAISSPLTGVTIDLPAPLGKVAGQEMALLVERKVSGGKAETIHAALGEIVFADLERVHLPGVPGSTLKRGTISFGKPGTLLARNGPAQDGLWLTGTLPAINLDEWRKVLKAEGARSAAATVGSSSTGAVSPGLVGVDLAFGSVDIFDRRFADLSVSARAAEGNWQGLLRSRELAGNFSWHSAGKGLLHARLTRLTLPSEKTPAMAPETPAVAETDFPALDIIADETQLKGLALGRLELKAEPQGKDWRIDQLRLIKPEATLDASGLWSGGAMPRTVMKVKLATADAGKLLADLGYADRVRRGQAELSGDLSWPGAPQQMLPANLSGNLQIEVREGQFLKANPRAGRLLGLLSLQSLPRRIALDFRDIFSEGLAFDTIRGEVQIRQGVMSTRDFSIVGPAAKVEMAGQVNLVHETQQLNVKVIPTLGEGISLASGFLAGPVVGVTAFLLQKAFADPIGRAAAYEYNISGNWDEPEVVKLPRKIFGGETQEE